MEALKSIEPKPSAAFRNKYLAAIMMVTALLISSVVSAQLDSAKYSPINGYGFKYKRMVFDSILMIPRSTSPHTPWRAGAIRYNAPDSTLQLWTGNQWNSILTGIGNGVDTAYMINDTLLVIETPDQNFMLAIPGRPRVDSIFRKSGQDSIFYLKNGVEYAIKDSTGGASFFLTNIGIGYPLAATPDGSIKRLSPAYGVIMDSTTTANSITILADTSSINHVVTQSDLNDGLATKLNAADTANKWINDIRRSNDSVYAFKNGSWQFKYRDSVGYGADSTIFSTNYRRDTAIANVRDEIQQITTVQVDSLIYIHSGSEVDTLTKTDLINKTILQVNLHPYTLFPTTTYAPTSDQVYFNSTTGGIKFGTAIQNGQQITILYKHTTSVGTAAVNSVNGQTGNITIDGSETKVQAGTNTTVTGSGTVASPYIVNASLSGGGATLTQVDSAVSRAMGKPKAVHMSCILRPTWNSGTSTTSWEILGVADAHDTAFSQTISLSIVGGQLRLNYSNIARIAGLQAQWDDVLAKDAYAIGPSVATSFAQFAIYRNFHARELWFGSDLLSGSYSGGPYFRIKCDTATGLFTVNWAYSSTDTVYDCEITPANYYNSFPRANIVTYYRTQTNPNETQFYLVDALTGQVRKGLLTTNDNFYVRIVGRRRVGAETENFGSNAAIFIDGVFITN